MLTVELKNLSGILLLLKYANTECLTYVAMNKLLFVVVVHA